jgi:hypothetical protein
LLEEQERRRSQAREEQGLLEDIRRHPTHGEGEQAGDERVKGVPFLVPKRSMSFMDTVVSLCH